jgi:hypothetical protein
MNNVVGPLVAGDASAGIPIEGNSKVMALPVNGMRTIIKIDSPE